MKLREIFYRIITLSVFVLASCNNLMEEDSTSLNNISTEATLSIDLQGTGRTILPNAALLSELENFQLIGILGEEDYYKYQKKYGYYYNRQRNFGPYHSITDLQNEKIKLDPGEWTFTLTAKKENTTYKAEKTQSIVQGENTISFNLVLEDSAMISGTGNFSLTLDFAEADNSEKVTAATAKIQTIDGKKVNGFSAKTLNINNGNVVYSETGLSAGSYRALITLYSGDLELLTWREIVVIADEHTSSGIRKLDSLNLYSINYVLNDEENSLASFDGAAFETYNCYSDIRNLPQVSRQYYDFKGWHLKSDLSDEVITELPENVNGNVSVYAEWKKHIYSISYNLNGGSLEGEYYITYTISDSFELPIPYKYDYIFDGWYSDDLYSDEQISNIEKMSSGNKIFYAKWEPVEHSITYILENGCFITSETNTYKESFDCLSMVPYKAGKTFIGWRLNQNISSKAVFTLIGKNNGNVTLYASWREPVTGDVILGDGRIITADFFDPSKMEAVAVLFISDGQYYGIGIHNSKMTRYKWCLQTATLYKDYVDDILISASNSSGNMVGALEHFSGDLDGSDNWELILSKDSIKENYPVFGFIDIYKNTINSSLYKNGWYVPSGYELRKIYLSIEKLNEILIKIDGDKILTDNYWSSNTIKNLGYGATAFTQNNTAAFAMSMNSGGCPKDSYADKFREYYVLVIRKFEW